MGKRVKCHDRIGQTYHQLTILRVLETGSNKKTIVECQCTCGNTHKVMLDSVVRGVTKSCGCRVTTGGLKHGYKGTPTYASWCAMKHRCNDKSNPKYGGRGVSYDPSWESFEVFLSDMGERPGGTTLDKDVKGGVGCLLYNKENCSWQSPKTQARHTRRSIGRDETLKIQEMHQQGMSNYRISVLTGRSYCTIKRALNSQ